jgi:hypothetical protein
MDQAKGEKRGWLSVLHLGMDPALEVDGRLFVDPNVDALKKIFRVK